MKYISIVMKKELYRVFSDVKMLFGLFVLPALLMVGIFLLVGVLAMSMMKDLQAHEPSVEVYNAPASFQNFYDKTETQTVFHIANVDSDAQIDDSKQMIYNGDLDLIVVFPEDFDAKVQSDSDAQKLPDVYTYYNPSEDYSNNAYEDMKSMLLEPYRQELQKQRFGSLERLQVFTINATNEQAVIQDENKAQGKMFGMIIPYLVTVLLFAGAMSLGADSFAGEKERGTMAAMLMAPIKRSYIVYGKMFALMILAGLSSMVYGGVMIFSVPMLYRTLGDVMGLELHFSAVQMLMMLALIVTLVFVYVGIIAVCATLAKNMKEASTYITPAYTVVMVLGVLSMFQGDKVTVFQYLIPLYGPTMALKNVFTLDITTPGFLLAVFSNLAVGCFLAWLTSRMFMSEKIMMNA